MTWLEVRLFARDPRIQPGIGGGRRWSGGVGLSEDACLQSEKPQSELPQDAAPSERKAAPFDGGVHHQPRGEPARVRPRIVE